MLLRAQLLAACLLLPCFASGQAYEPRFAREHADLDFYRAVECPMPKWPKSSLRNEETGTVTLMLKVTSTGRVIETRVVRSSGFRDLDRAAQTGMSQCLFRPATIKGQPVQSAAYMQYIWTLE